MRWQVTHKPLLLLERPNLLSQIDSSDTSSGRLHIHNSGTSLYLNLQQTTDAPSVKLR